MKKIIPIILLLLIFIAGTSCAKKKRFGFSGKETEEQAFNQCTKLNAKEKYQEALDCLEIFKSRYPGSNLSTEAELKIADSYFSKKEYLIAAETYLMFARLHPNSNKSDYAYYKAGLSYWYAAPKSIDRNQENLPEAVDNFRVVMNQFPNSTYAKMSAAKYNEARLKLGKRQMYIGKLYYKWGEYLAAAPRFKEVITNYSKLGLDEDALYLLAKSYRKLGKEAEANAAMDILKEEYPLSKKAK